MWFVNTTTSNNVLLNVEVYLLALHPGPSQTLHYQPLKFFKMIGPGVWEETQTDTHYMNYSKMIFGCTLIGVSDLNW